MIDHKRTASLIIILFLIASTKISHSKPLAPTGEEITISVDLEHYTRNICGQGVKCFPPIEMETAQEAFRQGLTLSSGLDIRQRYELDSRIKPLVDYVVQYPDSSAKHLLSVSNAHRDRLEKLDLTAGVYEPKTSSQWVGEVVDKTAGSISYGGKEYTVKQKLGRSLLIYALSESIEQGVDSYKQHKHQFYSQPSAQLDRFNRINRSQDRAAVTFMQAYGIAAKSSEAKKALDVILQEYGLSTSMTAEELANRLNAEKPISKKEIEDILSKKEGGLNEHLQKRLEDANKKNMALLEQRLIIFLLEQKNSEQSKLAEARRKEIEAQVEAIAANGALEGSALFVGMAWSLLDPKAGKEIQRTIRTGLEIYRTIEKYRPALNSASTETKTLGTIATVTNVAALSFSLFTMATSPDDNATTYILNYLEVIHKQLDQLQTIVNINYSHLSIQLGMLTDLTRENFNLVKESLRRGEANQKVILTNLDKLNSALIKFEENVRNYTIESINILKTNNEYCLEIEHLKSTSRDLIRREFLKCSTAYVDLAARSATSSVQAGRYYENAREKDLDQIYKVLYGNVFGSFDSSIPPMSNVPLHINELKSLSEVYINNINKGPLPNPAAWSSYSQELLKVLAAFRGYKEFLSDLAPRQPEKLRNQSDSLIRFYRAITPGESSAKLYGGLVEQIDNAMVEWKLAESGLRYEYEKKYLRGWSFEQLIDFKTLENPSLITDEMRKSGFKDISLLQTKSIRRMENSVPPCPSEDVKVGSIIIDGENLPKLNKVAVLYELLMTIDSPEGVTFAYCHNTSLLPPTFHTEIEGNGITSALRFKFLKKQKIKVRLEIRHGDKVIATRDWISKEPKLVYRDTEWVKEGYSPTALEMELDYWRTHGAFSEFHYNTFAYKDGTPPEPDLYEIAALPNELTSLGSLVTLYDESGSALNDYDAIRKEIKQHVITHAGIYQILVFDNSLGIIESKYSVDESKLAGMLYAAEVGLAAPLDNFKAASKKLYASKALLSAYLDLGNPLLIARSDNITKLLFGDFNHRIYDPWALRLILTNTSAEDVFKRLSMVYKENTERTKSLLEEIMALGKVQMSEQIEHPHHNLVNKLKIYEYEYGI